MRSQDDTALGDAGTEEEENARDRREQANLRICAWFKACLERRQRRREQRAPWLLVCFPLASSPRHRGPVQARFSGIGVVEVQGPVAASVSVPFGTIRPADIR